MRLVRARSAVPSITAPPASGPAELAPGGSTWRLAVLASISMMFLATSSAPTPLYPIYQAEWSLSVGSISLVFGVYALALLGGLLALARLSDHWGRRPVIWAALAVQVLAMVMFVLAPDIGWLLFARVLQGISTGAGLSAVGAALLDEDVRRGTIASAAVPPLGSAAGAMGAAALAQYAPAPTQLVFLILIGLLVAQSFALWLVPDRSPRAPGALASLVPRINLPQDVRASLLAASPVLFSVWAVCGLFGALGPKLVFELSGTTSPILGALPITVVGATSPIVALATAKLSARTSLNGGIVALVIGGAGVAVAALTSSWELLIVAAAIAGVAFGLGFRGGMQLVLPAVKERERAGTLSLLYLASYLGFGLPVIAAGIVTGYTDDLRGTTIGYVIMLVLLAAASLLVLFRSRDTTHPFNAQE